MRICFSFFSLSYRLFDRPNSGILVFLETMENLNSGRAVGIGESLEIRLSYTPNLLSIFIGLLISTCYNSRMSTKEHVQHWKNLANRDWKTARGLFELKRYDACLFFCHLTLEKLLKGLVINHTKKDAPFIHDLERLAVMTNLSEINKHVDDLKSISAFNIAGRYSDYKFSFYKKCTHSYTMKYLSKTEELIKWLKKKYPKP